MSVHIEPSGRRSVQVEVEVPGTPEEVWRAIATGPGISSWFVPAELEERDGVPVTQTLHFGREMAAQFTVTAYDAPRRFATEAPGWIPGSPPMAVEWTVEARAGGTCLIRIVHSLFASTDDWDDQLEATKGAWPGFLRTLRLYLTHFRGQRSAIMQVTTPVACTEAETWATLTRAFGVEGVRVGEAWATPAGSPPLSGMMEYVTEAPYDALMRLDAPRSGIAALGAMTYPDGRGMVAVNFYLYGDDAVERVASDAPVWQAWLEERFPLAEATA